MPADPAWWETFFHGTMLEFWTRAVTEAQTAREVDYIEAALALPDSARVLDVPCGNGRHALALAARGYPLTGIDLPPPASEDVKTSTRKAL